MILKIYGLLSYDAVNVGLQDLAMGVDFLKDNAKASNIPLISANIIDKKNKKTLFQPYIIKEIAGAKFGIFGLTSDSRIRKYFKNNINNIEILPPMDTAKKIVKELKAKGINVIIALSNLGYGNDIKLAKNVSGINFIVESWSYLRLNYPRKVDKSFILSPHFKGQYIGKLSIFLKSGAYNFYNPQQEKVLKVRIKGYEAQMKYYRRLAKGMDPAEYFKNDKKRLWSINKLKKLIEDTKKELEEHTMAKKRGDVSIIHNELFAMQLSLSEDKEIKKIIKRLNPKIEALLPPKEKKGKERRR